MNPKAGFACVVGCFLFMVFSLVVYDRVFLCTSGVFLSRACFFAVSKF